MEEIGPKICEHTTQLKKAKFGNCLAKVQEGKSDFKSKSANSKFEPEELWICVKTYKVGSFEQLEVYVNLPKNKKSSIIVNPIKEQYM